MRGFLCFSFYFHYSCLLQTHTPRGSPCLARGSAVLGVDRFLDAFGFENQILTFSAGSGGQGSISVLNAAEGADEEALHLGGGSGDCRWYVGRVVGDGECLVAFVTDFEAAAFVLRSGLVSVFVAEMDFNASELVFESVQNPVEIGLNQVGEFVVHGDVLIAADLNLHSLNSFSLACPVRRLECCGSGQILAVEGLAGCAKLFWTPKEGTCAFFPES
jgi:hypothetical protein